MLIKNADFFDKENLSDLITDIGVALWVYDILEDKIYCNNVVCEMLDIEVVTRPLSMKEWKNIFFKQDEEYLSTAFKNYMTGKSDSLYVEFRVVKPNNEIIWILNKGKFTKYDENGNPLILAGVLNNITQRKTIELKAKSDEQTLKLAMEYADFSVWDWDIVNDVVKFDGKYAKSLGYENEDICASLQLCYDITHPDDLPLMKKAILDYKNKIKTTYDCKIRIRKANGEYIWIRDVGETITFDELGNPTRIIGGRLNIDEVEKASIQLENYQEELQAKIDERTIELVTKDKILLEINHVSQKLMASQNANEFNQTVSECIAGFSGFGDKSRIAIFKHKDLSYKSYSSLVSQNNNTYKTEFTIDFIRDTFKDVDVSIVSEGEFDESTREDFYQSLMGFSKLFDLEHLNYQESAPTFFKYVCENKVLNAPSYQLSPKEIIYTKLQGVKSVIMSPINIGNKPWGYIVLDLFEEKSFGEDYEKMLVLIGSVFAQAIHKNELELENLSAQEHNQIMFDGIPLCCNLWYNGRNIKTNEVAVTMFKLKNQEEYLEKFHLLSPEYQPCGRKSEEFAMELVKQTLETGHSRFEWMHQTLEQELIPCEITLVRITMHDKIYVAGYTRDLRELKALLEANEKTQAHLKQAHEEALLSSKAKTNFLANMSHEIRTPMNAISGMTDIILNETQDENIVDYAGNIKRACDSLLSIINDVLDISKIESGKLDIVEGEYSLSTILNDVLSIASNRLELKDLMFTSKFQYDLPDKIIGDEVRIKQIMVNILNNAIKFTESGCIKFDVSGDYSGGLLMLKFSITDTGVGITPEDIKKLFIEFERVDTTKNRAIEGTGLGLAISKRLCEMMDGHIDVESEVGVGTTFTITVYQKYEDYTPIAKVEESKSILIFEPRELYLNSILYDCQQLGLTNVVACSTQSQFNEAIQGQEFDLVFVSYIYIFKVQEIFTKLNINTKIILLADTQTIKAKFDYTTIITPTNTIAIANIINGKAVNGNNKFINKTKFTAPDCKVLVVDDNKVNLKVAQGLMRPYQFEVTTASNGQLAVEKIINCKYDIVFMDHMMPIMDGVDATGSIRSIKEDYFQNLPIIALTANAIVGTKELFLNAGMNDFLAKPIKVDKLNDILSKWLPKEKQIKLENEIDIDVINTENITTMLQIESIDINLGMSRIGGNFDTYVEILNMYYKDGVKRIPNISNYCNNKDIANYKIEVHALKAASASIGATDISNQAKLLEDACIEENIVYIEENNDIFINNFNLLLLNIQEALKEIIIVDHNSTEKIIGDTTFYNESLTNLIDSLDSININKCDEILNNLFKFNWNEIQFENLNKIKDLVESYEFDLAIEFLENSKH